MKTRIGNTFEKTIECSSIASALRYVPELVGYGYIWVKHGNHWAIAGNYRDGKAWNGSYAQCVPGNAEDIAYLARHT